MTLLFPMTMLYYYLMVHCRKFFSLMPFFCVKQKKYITADTSNLLKNPPLSNRIVLRKNLHRKPNSLLTLEGFWQSDSTPPKIQQNSTVCSYFLENTWLGSPDFAGSKHCIRWIVFGSEQLIRPGNRYATRLGPTDIFTSQVSTSNTNRNYIDQINFQTSPSLTDDEIYTIFGPLILKPKNWLTRNRNDPYWIIEIGSKTLKHSVVQGNLTTGFINELLNSVEEARISVTESDPFQNYKRKIQRKQQIEAVNRLKERQKRAQMADRIHF